MISKCLCLILCLFCCTGLIFSQTAENQLLRIICEDAIKQNDYYLLKQKLTGFVIVTDPVNSTQVVQYPANANANTVANFSKYSKEEQIAILNSPALPIFPIVDTVIIVDTLNFFSEGIAFSKGHYCFIVRKKTRRKHMSLYAVGVRGNNLILSFAFSSGTDLFNYYFNLKPNTVSLLKTSTVAKTPLAE